MLDIANLVAVCFQAKVHRYLLTCLGFCIWSLTLAHTVLALSLPLSPLPPPYGIINGGVDFCKPALAPILHFFVIPELFGSSSIIYKVS